MKEAFEKIRKKLDEESVMRANSEKFYSEPQNGEYVDCVVLLKDALSIVSEVEAEYKDKFVSVGVLEQIMWERDVAIAQLKELGYGLGEKIRKVEAEYGNGWIPCSERLPEKSGRVLVSYESINDEIAVSETSYDYKRKTFWISPCVIAWMPLPSPYKPTTD